MSRQLFRAAIALIFFLIPAARVVRAELHCAAPVFQAGQVRNGLDLTHTFALVNDGTTTLEIVDIRPTCGCLSPQLDRRTLGPGQKATLQLAVNTLALAPGFQSWRTRLMYRDGDKTGELELTIIGEVVTEVLVQPTALTLPAELTDGREITVADCRTNALTVVAADTGSAVLKAQVGLAQRDGGRSVQKIRLEVPADCPEGRHNLVLHIYTNDPLYRELKVPITVVKRGRQRVAAAPAQVTIEGDRNEPLPARLVRLSAADDNAVVVERIESDSPALRCSWASGPGTAATVKIQVDQTHLTGDLNTAIHVHVSKPAVETVTIPVLCVVR